MSLDIPLPLTPIAEEASHLLEYLESEVRVPHWQIIIKLAITTGMRRSKLYGLEFKHFDYKKSIVHVEQALTYSKDDGYQVQKLEMGIYQQIIEMLLFRKL
ncbi:tyrosine-type recombinase/integrase [Ornithinibacillus sp. L9]|uniref:Tyrosine-type recombinase/integrase n=1 Tax=Ornithinibacillus caprae TaxID=2678566 RepID=A0A6N8FJT7_9BACI|nr:tyrosine-type recombinase/integrase [Ornithinibacillus caprae]